MATSKNVQPNSSERVEAVETTDTSLTQNPYLLGVALFASIGGFLFGYDQGVVSGVLTMESFGAKFPRIYVDPGFKGWFVSTILLTAWFGSLINGPLADRFGRKRDIVVAVVIFVAGSVVQAGAINVTMLFFGRAFAGLAIGMLTMVIPLYISEVSQPNIRGGLVVLQQLSITIGILVSFWIDYGTHYIGGTKCSPEIAYTGGSSPDAIFDPYNDVGSNGCTGQSDASWRVPLSVQVLPAIILGLGIIFFPDSPRWLMMQDRDDDARLALSKLRRLSPNHHRLISEQLEIKASIVTESANGAKYFGGAYGFRLHVAQYMSLVNNLSRFRRLAIGCCVMFFQQFIGCNALIYYAPTIFAQLGLGGNTTSLLATGVYGIVNTLSTIPAVLFIDKFGRRPLLMTGAFGTCISLLIVGIITRVYGSTLTSHPAAGWTAIAFIYMYDIFFSFSFGPIGWVLPSEIFPQDIRSKAVSITTSTAWMCNFVIGLVTPDMLDKLGWGTYIFFAGFAAAAFLFVWTVVLETKGRKLEDMDGVFGIEGVTGGDEVDGGMDGEKMVIVGHREI